ncbi:PAS domain-containing protein [Allorhizobium terrae]|uniref:histidine kinase n=1 Tax=Allorhizobium terrae TaxID=1848972 RepID=A0A4S4A5T9_9HYPH|nr:PAS domain-containing protein [Allorhizobium terrae]
MPVEGGLLAIACEKIAKLDVPAFIKDSELRFVAVNPAFEAFSGYDRASLLGHDMGTLTGRPEDCAWEDMERRALVFADEQLALCFDGSGQEHCRVQIERFVTEDEKLFVFGVFRERPRQSKGRLLKRSRHAPPVDTVPAKLLAANDTMQPTADFPALLDALATGVLLLDGDLRIAYFNHVIVDMFAAIGHRPRAGDGYLTLVDAILAEKGQGAQIDRQGLVDLVMTRDVADKESLAARRIPLGKRIVDISRKTLPCGNILLQISDVTDLQAFEHESLLYRSVLENVPEPVFLRDSARRLIFANAAYEQMLGEDRTRFYGMTEDEMFLENGAQLRSENDSVLETGMQIEREQVITMPNGVAVPLLTSLHRIEDGDGARYIVGTLADISILKVSERALVEARAQAEALYQQFERILRTMPIGVVIWDQDLTISFANSKAREIVNWPDDRPINGVSGADYIRHAYDNGWPLIAEGEDLDARIAARCAEIKQLNGTQQYERTLDNGCHVLVSMTSLEHGQILVTYTDYTEKHLREREIREARARLEDVGTLLKEASQVMTQGLCVVAKHKILYANDKFAEILDLPAPMVAQGADWQALYDASMHNGAFETELAELLADMTSRLANEKSASGVLKRHDGVWVNLEVLVSGEGRWLFVVRDISDAKNREAELTALASQAEAADKAKSRFLASMGQEIRTPMSGVLGMAELLISSDLDARQKTFVDVILKSGRSLLTIINDILDFAKIDDRSLSLRKAPFDPMAAVEDVILLMAGRAAEKDIELLVRGHGGIKHLVSADAGRFRQILTKLVDEAIKATDKGHVLVELSEQKESDDLLWLTLQVEDTGRGFTPEQRSLAFSKFSQFEEPPVFHKGGAGLALSIVGGLVELFGGTIGILSEPGEGAVITVRLPLAIAGEKISERSALHLQGSRVLALAENALSCSILNDQLAQWGFDGVALTEPEIAFGVLREAIVVDQVIEVLVVDVQKAGDAAIDFIRRVRRDGLFNRLAILALMPGNLSGLHDELGDMNVQAQLHKPVADTLLRNAISDVLKAARRALRHETPQEEIVRVKGPLHQMASRLLPSQPSQTVMIVNASDVEGDFFRHTLSEAGIGFQLFASQEQAFSLWQQQRPRVMLIDLTQDDAGAFEFLSFVRAEEGRTPHLPPTALIGLASRAVENDSAVYLTAGLDDLLVLPLSPAKLLACLQHWSAEHHPQPQMALS